MSLDLSMIVPEPRLLASARLVPVERRVPERLVHKTSRGEVLIAGGEQLRADRFLVFAKLPAGHHFYRSNDFGRVDQLLVVEAMRQAAYFVSHQYYEVPLDYQFVLGDVACRMEDHCFRTYATGELPVVLRITCEPTARRTANRIGLRMTAEFSVHGVVFARGSLRSEALGERIYRAMRSRSDAPDGPAETVGLPAALLPQAVGRLDPADVVLADIGRADRWLLRVDESHPVLFDHPLDHVPGMLLIDAFRQAAWRAAGAVAAARFSMNGLHAEFASFCELRLPAYIIAMPRIPRRADELCWAVRAVQSGKVVASGLIASVRTGRTA